ncbi:hypothetical protein J6590_011740 [Homalodisca vitripennis]|nr:hypothetical protein J6590_011740 [Homalodisca vitripennis]
MIYREALDRRALIARDITVRYFFEFRSHINNTRFYSTGKTVTRKNTIITVTATHRAGRTLLQHCTIVIRLLISKTGIKKAFKNQPEVLTIDSLFVSNVLPRDKKYQTADCTQNRGMYRKLRNKPTVTTNALSNAQWGPDKTQYPGLYTEHTPPTVHAHIKLMKPQTTSSTQTRGFTRHALLNVAQFGQF